MNLYTFTTGPLENNSYLVEYFGKCVLFDAPIESFTPISKFIESSNWHLSAIILTHSHFDHIVDLQKFKAEYNPEIYLHKDDEFRLINPGLELPPWAKIEIEPCREYTFVEDEQILDVENMHFKILHTPGHTAGGICIELLGENKIITGDTLFNLSVGRTDFEGGNGKELMESITNKLLSYPDEYEIYPGHMGSSTIGTEKKFNPFLKNLKI